MSKPFEALDTTGHKIDFWGNDKPKCPHCGDDFERVLSALTEIIKFETDPVFAKLAQRRFLDITDKETEHAA